MIHKSKQYKIALLCHGRRHRQYGQYYKSALQIDIDIKANPDIIHNLNKGMPHVHHKFDLIQTVYWPQLHRIKRSLYRHLFSRCTRLRTPYNMILLRSIVLSLKRGGFFVFLHNGTTYHLTKVCEQLGLKRVSLKFVQKKLGFRLCPVFRQSEKWAMLCFRKK